MISKDELIKIVAQSCGISVEISSFFFEVFVNRISNTLKPGDLLHFHDHGYFHKRNCRIQLEKSHDSPIPKSYLIQLVIFSEEAKIKSDLSSVHFLKIANLKTLWVDDKDFQKSLSAGDFAPHSDRNQLIKSFATKSEVIIAGLRKDYDSELVEELIIPLTFDLNFLIKSGQKSKSAPKSMTDSPLVKSEDNKEVKGKDLVIPKEGFNETKTIIQKIDKTGSEESLPWNYGAKFLNKEKPDQVDAKEEKFKDSDKKNVDEIKKPEKKLKDFEPVSSRLSSTKEEKALPEAAETAKFSVSGINESEEQKEEKKFTEVKSKTDAFRYQSDTFKNKNRIDDRRSGRLLQSNSRDKVFRDHRSFIPLVAIIAFVIIAVAVVYIYFIRDNSQNTQISDVIKDVRPPSSANIIERDNEFAVTYPYPKTENRSGVSGYDKDLFSGKDTKSVVDTELKTEEKKETPPEVKGENKPVTEIKTQPPVEQKENKVETPKEEKSNRIFLYKNFYVVYVATFKSEADANREADRYFDLGYNAIVEVVERGNNSEYRLIVGDFTSIEFANQFQEKYIK